MTQGIRIVSRFPAPDCFQEYEPFSVKGADASGRRIAVQTMGAPDQAEQVDLQKALATFFAKGIDGGIWPLEMFPSAVFFSLDLACNSLDTIPKNFELFIQLCHSIDVEIYLICNRADPVVVKVYTLQDLFAAHQVLLLPEELTGGIQRELKDSTKRVDWLLRLLKTQQKGVEKVAFVTDRAEDAVFASVCPHVVSFCPELPTLPIHAQIRSQDCAYLAYLLFGREVTAVRRHGY